ncbi:MAG: hypothetical protein ABFR02_01380 [Campylobacterota bacterium]
MTVKITNPARIKDYKSILGNTVTLVSGFDEKLCLHDTTESITEKAIRCGKGHIIEDTTLLINGKVYNTVSSQDHHLNDKKAAWTTKIAYHSGFMIHFYEASVSGRIKISPSNSVKKLSIGNIFIPDGYNTNLSEIEHTDDVAFINARQLALKKLLLGQSFHVELIEPLTSQVCTADTATAQVVKNRL